NFNLLKKRIMMNENENIDEFGNDEEYINNLMSESKQFIDELVKQQKGEKNIIHELIKRLLTRYRPAKFDIFEVFKYLGNKLRYESSWSENEYNIFKNGYHTKYSFKIPCYILFSSLKIKNYDKNYIFINPLETYEFF